MRLMKFVGGLALLGVAMGAVALLPPTEDPTLFSEAFFDAGHVPMFLVFTLIVLWLARMAFPEPPVRKYLVAGALVVLAGLGTEFVQKFVARDAGWTDFFRDLLGGGAALLLALAIENRRPVVKAVSVLGALALIGVGLAELVSVHLDYRGRDAAFPLLAGFEESWEPRFVHGHDADLEPVAAPAEWTSAAGGIVGRLDTHVADYPSLSIEEPFPDWSEFDVLVFEVWSDLEGSIDLWVRVHDRAHDGAFSDRYNAAFTIAPGSNEVVVPLREVQAAPRDRELDLQHVDGIAFFFERPSGPRRLWFRNLRLERAGS